MKKGLRFLICASALAALLTLSACSGSTVTSSSPAVKTMQWSSAPAMTINPDREYQAVIKTNYGDITIQLLPREAPLAVNNFVFLARQGYFDGVKFHRIAKGFVIQSGDPTGTGSGTPGYRFADETITRDYLKGTLAMANSGANTNGSQFFITLANLTGQLPKSYTIFGLVSQGIDVVDKIAAVPVAYNASLRENSKPTVDVYINTVVITETAP
jgi:cyclophilin family peptidyl-prolyl cis-trans isomerase